MKHMLLAASLLAAGLFQTGLAQAQFPKSAKLGISMPPQGGVEDWGMQRPAACDLTLGYVEPILARHESVYPSVVAEQRSLVKQVGLQFKAASEAAMLQSAKLNSVDATTGGKWYGQVLQTAKAYAFRVGGDLTAESVLVGLRRKEPSYPSVCNSAGAPPGSQAGMACATGAQMIQVLVQTELFHQQLCLLEGQAYSVAPPANALAAIAAPVSAPTATPVAAPAGALPTAPTNLGDQCGKRVFLAREKCFAELCEKPENKEAWECKRRDKGSADRSRN